MVSTCRPDQEYICFTNDTSMRYTFLNETDNTLCKGIKTYPIDNSFIYEK